MNYSCDCGYDPPEYPYYILFGKIRIARGVWNKANKTVSFKTPFRRTLYPKMEGYAPSTYASMEFGIDGHDWNEVHYCPHCKKEFAFWNSDF